MTQPDSLPRSAPAALRNRDAILDILRGALPPSGLVLELASGTGEHIVHFAQGLPHLTWQPSDPSPQARQSIEGWAAQEALPNLRPPIDLEAQAPVWPVTRAAAIVCINMVHISPWEATVGLMRGAGGILPAGGLLYLYGPYRRADRPLEPGNALFDEDLRARDHRWGLRALDEVVACARAHGLGFVDAIDMPANNVSLLLAKG